MAQLRPLNIYGNYLAGRQAADVEHETDRRNALADRQLREQERINTLRRDPNTTPEQLIREGDTATANALVQHSQVGQQQKQAAIKQIGDLAKQAIGSGKAREFVGSAIRNPAYAQVFKDAGFDPAQIDLNSPTFDQDLQAWASIAGGVPQKLETIGNTSNPAAGVWQRDPVTGEIKQVTAPQRPERPQSQGAQWRYLTPEEIKQRGLPEGTSAQLDVTSGKVGILNKREGLSAAEQKTIREAKMRMPRLDAAIRRVERLGQAVTSISKNPWFDGGPLDAKALRWSPQGQEIEASAAQLMPELQALTRVPGIGSQSDLEARLAQLALPSLSMSPEVNARSQAELASFINDLKSAYASLLEGSQPTQAPQQPAASGGWSIEEVR